jgi:hypothetical protein
MADQPNEDKRDDLQKYLDENDDQPADIDCFGSWPKPGEDATGMLPFFYSRPCVPSIVCYHIAALLIT